MATAGLVRNFDDSSKLIQYGLLQFPVLYISGYINQHRSDYYRHLLAVTKEHNWHGFIEYMLDGFYVKAMETREDLKKITVLFDQIKDQIRAENKKIYGLDLVEALFTYPVITPTKLATELNMHYTTTSKYLAQLAEMGILKDTKVGKHHLFVNHRLLKIIKKPGILGGGQGGGVHSKKKKKKKNTAYFFFFLVVFFHHLFKQFFFSNPFFFFFCGGGGRRDDNLPCCNIHINLKAGSIFNSQLLPNFGRNDDPSF